MQLDSDTGTVEADSPLNEGAKTKGLKRRDASPDGGASDKPPQGGRNSGGRDFKRTKSDTGGKASALSGKNPFTRNLGVMFLPPPAQHTRLINLLLSPFPSASRPPSPLILYPHLRSQVLHLLTCRLCGFQDLHLLTRRLCFSRYAPKTCVFKIALHHHDCCVRNKASPRHQGKRKRKMLIILRTSRMPRSLHQRRSCWTQKRLWPSF